MYFLSDDLLHIDTVLEQVAEHPQTGSQVCPLIHLVRQNLRCVTERVRLLEEWSALEGDGFGGGSAPPALMASNMRGHHLISPFSAEDLEQYDVTKGVRHGFFQ